MAPQETSPSSTEYKLNIMQRLGGESVFGFIVLGMVERLQQDEALKPFFANFRSSNLDKLQREVLKAMFTKKQQMDNEHDYDADGFILLRYYSLMEQQGFDETHFDNVVQHFLESLEDAWVDAAIVNDAVSIVKSFRPIFVHKSNIAERRRRTANSSTTKEQEEANNKRKDVSSNVLESSFRSTEESTASASQRPSSSKSLLSFIRPARGTKKTSTTTTTTTPSKPSAE